EAANSDREGFKVSTPGSRYARPEPTTEALIPLSARRRETHLRLASPSMVQPPKAVRRKRAGRDSGSLGRLDREAHAGAPEALEEDGSHGGGRGEDSAHRLSREPIAVESERERRLREHEDRRAVAGISAVGDLTEGEP